ncbi:MAG: hypothetical protein WC974_08965 [Thermoplasmata archaeon]
MNLKPIRINPYSNELLEYLPRWQNNNKKYLGIYNFAIDLFPDIIMPKYGIAPWASTALRTVLYYEDGMTKEDRCHVIATYRGGSKTSWFTFILPLYNILVGQYGIYWEDSLLPAAEFQVVKSKTGKEARKRLYNISNALNKPIVKQISGELKPSFKAVKDREGKDTGDLVILTNGYILEGSGIEQPTRGSNILGKRIDFINFDDPENRENTQTMERRETNRKEVMEESFGAVEDDGMILYIGNKIHQDDTLGKLMNPSNKAWKKQFYTYTVKRINGRRYNGIGDMDNEEPEWTMRYTIENCKKRMEWFISQPDLGGAKGFFKEYYNRIKSDQDYKISTHECEVVSSNGHNWLITTDLEGKKAYENCYIVIGNDPAISEAKTSSDAVIVANAFTSSGKRKLLQISKGKYDLHDRYIDESKAPLTLALNVEEMSNVKRKGSVEEVVRMILKYKADGAVIEVAGQQRAFFNEIKLLLTKLNIFIPVMPYAPSINKVTKLKGELLIYWEAGLYYIRKEMTELKNEVDTFPDSKLDTLDAIHLTEQIRMKPNKVEFDETLYNDKMVIGKTNDSYTPPKDCEAWIVL